MDIEPAGCVKHLWNLAHLKDDPSKDSFALGGYWSDKKWSGGIPPASTGTVFRWGWPFHYRQFQNYLQALQAIILMLNIWLVASLTEGLIQESLCFGTLSVKYWQLLSVACTAVKTLVVTGPPTICVPHEDSALCKHIIAQRECHISNFKASLNVSHQHSRSSFRKAGCGTRGGRKDFDARYLTSEQWHLWTETGLVDICGSAQGTQDLQNAMDS